MKDTLAAGLEGSEDYVVTDDMSPPHLPVKVLSTPDMIRLIEQTCLMGAQPHLDDGETTVGVHVCVSHSASVNAGDTVRIRYKLAERDRRRLVFETTVHAGETLVSEGTHQRFVVSP